MAQNGSLNKQVWWSMVPYSIIYGRTWWPAPPVMVVRGGLHQQVWQAMAASDRRTSSGMIDGTRTQDLYAVGLVKDEDENWPERKKNIFKETVHPGNNL